LCVHFFFQAEDGIRDRNVTGVQTCALPIFPHKDANLDFGTSEKDGMTIRQLVKEKYFTVEKWEVSADTEYAISADFLQVDVIEGDRKSVVAGEEYELTKGVHFILPNGVEHIKLGGDMELI